MTRIAKLRFIFLAFMAFGLLTVPEAYAGQLHFNDALAKAGPVGVRHIVQPLQSKAVAAQPEPFGERLLRPQTTSAAVEVPMGREARAALSLSVSEPGSLPLATIVMLCAALAAGICWKNAVFDNSLE